MPNTQYPFSPRDWSSEISYPQPAAHASASSTTTTTTTSTSSASSVHNPTPQVPMPQASVPGAQASAPRSPLLNLPPLLLTRTPPFTRLTGTADR